MAITLKRLSEKMANRVGQVKTYESESLARKVRSVGKVVIKSSPIDTGRFVGGWRTKAGEPDLLSPSRTGQSTRSYNKMKRDLVSHKRTSAAVANSAQEEKAALADLNSVADGIKDGGKSIFLSNNVPYASTLEKIGSRYGPRKQDAGFILRAIKQGSAGKTGKLKKHVFTS